MDNFLCWLVVEFRRLYITVSVKFRNFKKLVQPVILLSTSEQSGFGHLTPDIHWGVWNNEICVRKFSFPNWTFLCLLNARNSFLRALSSFNKLTCPSKSRSSWHSFTIVVVVWHQQFRFEISLILRNVAIYGVVRLKARYDRRTSNIVSWLSYSVEIVRIYCFIRDDTESAVSSNRLPSTPSCEFPCFWLDSKVFMRLKFSWG